METGDDAAPITRREFYRALVLIWTFIALAFSTTVFRSRSILPTNAIYLMAALLMVANYMGDRLVGADRKWRHPLIGSSLVGAWVAQFAFWVLIALGIAYGVLGKRAAAIFVALWLAGFVWVPRIAWWATPMVTSYVAVLDIVLVFMVFKGDVRIG